MEICSTNSELRMLSLFSVSGTKSVSMGIIMGKTASLTFFFIKLSDISGIIVLRVKKFTIFSLSL